MIRLFLYVTLLFCVYMLCEGNDSIVEKKLEHLENIISGMQTFIMHDMLLMKTKLAETDKKIEQIFDRLDNTQGVPRLVEKHDESYVNMELQMRFTELTNKFETKLGGLAQTLSNQTKAIADLEHKFENSKINSNNKMFEMTLNRIKHAFMHEKVILAKESRSLHETSETLRTVSKNIMTDVITAIEALNRTQATSVNNMKLEFQTVAVSVKEDFRETVNNISQDVVKIINDTGNYLIGNVLELKTYQTKFNNLTIAQIQEIQLLHSRLDDIYLITNSDSIKLNMVYEVTTMNYGFIGNNLYYSYTELSGTVSPSVEYYFYVPGARARLANVTRYDTNGVQGRLEVDVNGEWGTVCNTNFDTKTSPNGEAEEENVSCRTLGAGFTKGLALPEFPFGQSAGKMIMDKDCDGHESSLFYCRDWGDSTICGHEREVHLRCFE
ncbi:uncharacterized protein LOC128222248 [Mya arenaria]|uniref:uncharacterized protein LOC128222248 n=1 Tax=Mya arenaria TaxID=6604 RepID=UPI0022E5FD21|nr:uncharacterized protein LOC128222248 [Mya arenaria]